ncbi:AMP-binding protein [Ottowia testudinis]|uniref:AMP-binding protein n=1 Tax=Ottowia testudinis TaxID=2816950 RepID=A0A975CDE5_9BURK|nr:AMP-binding protein [Ottowia testudinis]QTD43686.1 AMP-binding protein [Ottowia testudinis]
MGDSARVALAPPCPLQARYPLSHHAPDEVLAYFPDKRLTAGRFFRDALMLAPALTSGGHVINACHDRYLFAVSLAATLLAGKLTLMPPSFATQAMGQLQAGYPDLRCLHDGRDWPEGIPGIRVQDHLVANAPPCDTAPLIDADRVATVMFTSGSTGEPTAHSKTWGRLCINGAGESARLGAAGMTIVATVPAQHMYGFESSVLMALHGGASCWHGRPFYPADIAEALAAAPAPRMLVSTPFHLATLLEAGLKLPACDLVLSATAPLSAELAERCEATLSAPLFEIYGCTESGQLASRRPVHGPVWQLFPGVQMALDAQGAWVHGGHVEGRVLLSDHIEAEDADRFFLRGRNADMVNVAGKRTSLAHLNALLLGIPGVVEGCFVQPDDEAAAGDGVIHRLAALVVSPSVDEAALLAALRARIDPVFLPRPLLRVDAMPRNATGKLVRADIMALYRERQRKLASDNA